MDKRGERSTGEKRGKEGKEIKTNLGRRIMNNDWGKKRKDEKGKEDYI